MKRALVAVAVPLALMLGWVAFLEIRLRTGSEVYLKAVGYDPRDLLSGHYLQFRVDVGSTVCDTKQWKTEPRCVCLGPSTLASPAEVTWSGDCDARPDTCSTYLQGECRYGNFTTGVERFYIPEAESSRLATIPPGAVAKLRVAPDGRAMLESLYGADGKPLLP